MTATAKTWKVSKESETGIQITDEAIFIVVGTAGHPNGIRIDDTGVYINGKLSLMADPEQVRVDGLFIQQSPWKDIFPSTVASPTPRLIINEPIGNLEAVAEGLAYALSNLM